MSDVVKDTIAAVHSGSIPALGVTFPNDKPISKPGVYLPRAEAAEKPIISYSTPSSTGKYLVVCIDLDAPFPSFAFLGPIIHWIQHDLVASSSGELTAEGGTKAITDYAGPHPPPISSPHRYVFLLYEQPTEFDRNKLGLPENFGLRDRMKWNQAEFEKKAGLGKVVAGNWFKSK